MDDRALIQLLGGISHDLSNVLLAIRVHASVSAANAATADPSPSADALRAATQRLQRLIESMQVLGGEGVGNFELERWWAQVSGLMAKVLPRGVDVAAEFAPVLPRVRADQGLLTRSVIQTLCQIAQHMPVVSTVPGRGRVLIVAAPYAGAGEVEICVRPDPGLGPEVRVAVLPAASPEVPVGRPSRAVVTVASDRSSAIVRYMLVTTLAPFSQIVVAPTPDGADLWIVEPGAGRLEAAQQWRNQKPGGLLILVGDPGEDERPRWEGLGVTAVARADDIEKIREALSHERQAVAAPSHGAIDVTARGGRVEGRGVGSGGASK
ncbi:MAG: hypothetical protein K2Q20_11075 [Phycisphaerales bacterium]|nr:hypothetical protein [Phycisphaerales bacterium]